MSVTASDLREMQIIDVDTHILEPYDLWTSRVSTKRWGSMVPHVRWIEEEQKDVWFFGDTKLAAAGKEAMAGWHKFPPDHPARLEDAAPELWDPKQRLQKMNNDGIHAQLLYPNVQGFGTGKFLAMNDTELMLKCIQAYNDFLVEWAELAPGRYVPIAALPFWDCDASVAEMQRAVDMGHKGLTFSLAPEYYGLPELTDRHWDRIWAAAQELDMSINFHIGSGDRSEVDKPSNDIGKHTKFASLGTKFFMGNVKSISDVIYGGICHRFPTLKFVSVESGVGWIPYALASMDWAWRNGGVYREHPEYELMPSEYFKRQIYACFWHEDATLRHALDQLGDENILYETDFPHPTSMSPGPASEAQAPLDYLIEHLGDLPSSTLQRILHDNAAAVYHL